MSCILRETLIKSSIHIVQSDFQEDCIKRQQEYGRVFK